MFAAPKDKERVLLSIRNLKTYFYSRGLTIYALDGVSFDIEKGMTFGLVGETGCGKSVTALSILRLIPYPPGKIVDGEIYFKGRNLLRLSEEEIRSIRGKEISMIFQEPMTSLNPAFRIGDQMMEVIMLHQKIGKQQAYARAVEMLERVQMPEAHKVMKQFPHQLSGGMRQRVMIALELSCHPSLLIADEPTTALDVTIQAQILKLLKEMKKEFDTSILLITHDLGIIAEMCERVAIMYAGSIVEEGPVEAVFEDPKHPYTKGLWGAIPRLEEEKDSLAVIPGTVPDLTQPPRGCKFHPRCSWRSDRCVEHPPSLIEDSPGHLVACFLYQGAEKNG